MSILRYLLSRLHEPALVLCAALMLAACNAEGEPAGNDTEDPPGQDSGGDGQPPSGDDDDEPGDGGEEPPDDGGECEDGEDDDCEEDRIASCGPGERFLPLVNNYADLGLRVRVRAGVDGGRCRHCSVRGEDDVIDNNLLSGARMMTPAGTSSSVYLTVSLPHAGHGMKYAGFMLSDPEGLAASGVLERIDIAVLRDGATVDRVDGGEDRMHVFDTGDMLRHLVLMRTKEGFDAVRIRLKGAAEKDNLLQVYAACVDRYGW